MSKLDVWTRESDDTGVQWAPRIQWMHRK